MSLKSITELPNEITNDIDIADPHEMIDLLCQSDAQIFHGYKDFISMMDQEMLDKLDECISAAEELLSDPEDSVILMSGAGTSGRLAMFIARAFGRLFPENGNLFQYLIAGGDLALIKSQEGAEDDPAQGIKELEERFANAKRGLFIGITCGMSAPYIAGQISWTLTKENVKSIFLGFNPVERARTTEIEDWHKTVREVAEEAEESPHCILLNPVVGPEPITGSTRMKGGSATKILLETIFFEAGRRAEKLPAVHESTMGGKAVLREYDNVRACLYKESHDLARLIALGAQCLHNPGVEAPWHKGHIYYLGDRTAGILGLVDASECPPTFGAEFEDVRGFLEGGWGTLLSTGVDLSGESEYYRISLDDFSRDILPGIGSGDLVVGLGISQLSEKVASLLADTRAKGVKTAAVVVNPAGELPKEIDVKVKPRLSFLGPTEDLPAYAEFALKLTVNALTTGAHVLTGKVYSNRMIDLRISNNKLYYRSIDIVSVLMGVSEDVARESVQKALYHTDTLTDEIVNAPISGHVRAATDQEKVVPKALLLATGKFSYHDACAALAQDPIVRNIIQRIVATG